MNHQCITKFLPRHGIFCRRAYRDRPLTIHLSGRPREHGQAAVTSVSRSRFNKTSKEYNRRRVPVLPDDRRISITYIRGSRMCHWCRMDAVIVSTEDSTSQLITDKLRIRDALYHFLRHIFGHASCLSVRRPGHGLGLRRQYQSTSHHRLAAGHLPHRGACRSVCARPFMPLKGLLSRECPAIKLSLTMHFEPSHISLY